MNLRSLVPSLGLGTALVTFGVPSFAAFDIAPITAAQTDALAAAGALVTLSVAVWAAMYIKGLFRR